MGPIRVAIPSEESARIAAYATIGGLFLMAGLILVWRFGSFRPTVFLIFLFTSIIAPLLSAFLVYRYEDNLNARATLVVAKAFLLSVLVTLLGLACIESLIRPRPVPLWILVAILIATAATTAVVARPKTAGSPTRPTAVGPIDAALVLALAAVVFVFSPFDPAAPVTVGFLDYIQEVPHFFYWLLVGIAWTAAGIWLRRREGWAFPHKKKFLESIAVIIAILVIVMLYDDTHFVDFVHYEPLVAPAIFATRGGVPMVDAFSQYGFLPWFIYRLAFIVFAPTFGTAAVVTRLINLCYFGLILATLCAVSRRRLSALVFYVPALIIAITSQNPGPTGMWNMNALPMTLGGRWWLPAAMALLLTLQPRRSWTPWAALALLAIASLASFEILAFTLAPWGFCLLLNAIRSRSARLLLVQCAAAGAAIIAAQALFVGIIYLSTGKLVNYELYFDLISQYQPSEDSFWSVPFVPNYALWLPVGLAYFLVMAAAGYRALRGDAPNSIVERLLPVAVFGLGPLAYFFGRPQEGTLAISCLAFAVVAIGIAETIFVNARRFGPVGPALAATVALAFAFATADGFEHFMRPPDPSRGNSSILRRCFTAEGCRLADVPRNVSFALHTQPLDPRTEVGYLVEGHRNERARITEAISMLRRLAPNDPTVGMLTDFYPDRYADASSAIGITAFMATHQWFAWSMTSPVYDGLSPKITNRVLKRVDATSSGLLVIVSKERTGWAPINQKILDHLAARCRLEPIETDEFLSALRTENCAR